MGKSKIAAIMSNGNVSRRESMKIVPKCVDKQIQKRPALYRLKYLDSHSKNGFTVSVVIARI
jgi:hypothetical protein